MRCGWSGASRRRAAGAAGQPRSLAGELVSPLTRRYVIDRVCDLPDLVDSLEITNPGISNSLMFAQAENACELFTSGSLGAAENKLGAFINEANALSGVQVIPADADLLIAFALNAIITL